MCACSPRNTTTNNNKKRFSIKQKKKNWEIISLVPVVWRDIVLLVGVSILVCRWYLLNNIQSGIDRWPGAVTLYAVTCCTSRGFPAVKRSRLPLPPPPRLRRPQSPVSNLRQNEKSAQYYSYRRQLIVNNNRYRAAVFYRGLSTLTLEREHFWNFFIYFSISLFGFIGHCFGMIHRDFLYCITQHGY